MTEGLLMGVPRGASSSAASVITQTSVAERGECQREEAARSMDSADGEWLGEQRHRPRWRAWGNPKESGVANIRRRCMGQGGLLGPLYMVGLR